MAWSQLQEGRQVYAVSKGAEFLCEGPFDRMDLDPEDANDETESSIRLFVERADASAYCEEWRRLLGDEPDDEQACTLKVIGVTLDEVWKYLGAIVTNSYVEYQTPPRIELTRLNRFGHPFTIDTLFTEREELH